MLVCYNLKEIFVESKEDLCFDFMYTLTHLGTLEQRARTEIGLRIQFLNVGGYGVVSNCDLRLCSFSILHTFNII